MWNYFLKALLYTTTFFISYSLTALEKHQADSNGEILFSDSCKANWQEKWFLDGDLAKVTNERNHLAIDTAKGYAVLWTKKSFAGDLRIEYDFKSADDNHKGVNIIYIQATGDGQNDCVEDISKWSGKRKTAAMSDYFMNMHTYHLSYAAYGNDPNVDYEDYIRARRYLPLANKGMKNTKLTGDYNDTGLFGDKKWVHVTITKKAKEFWVEFKHPDKTLLCHFKNTDKPSVEKGRIGLRLMPGRRSHFKNFKVMSLKTAKKAFDWQRYTGKPGHSGWKAHVLQPDPKNHGPDGINIYDWDSDGHNDVFVNYEEGKYSRLYFNPGKEVQKVWTDYLEFKHGQCEDSGMGDLDNDGDIDYIANGGQIYFNPGSAHVKDKTKWAKMVLFKNEERAPLVTDIDGDGLKDLVVGGKRWYKQPVAGKHKPENWEEFSLGKASWVMSCISYDVDKDGDNDIVVQDRRKETFWYVNPGKQELYKPWPRKTIYNKNKESMFMEIADANGDGIDDFIITGGRIGEKKGKIIILLRTNKTGDPTFKEIILDQPKSKLGKHIDFFPKGVRLLEIDGNLQKKEILIMPKKGDMWYATFNGDSMKAENWQSVIVPTPGAETRFKMDNVYVGDIDGDGDLDILTTEENSGWGVIWFENPEK